MRSLGDLIAALRSEQVEIRCCGTLTLAVRMRFERGRPLRCSRCGSVIVPDELPSTGSWARHEAAVA